MQGHRKVDQHRENRFTLAGLFLLVSASLGQSLPGTQLVLSQL